MKKTKAQKQVTNEVYGTLSLVAAVVLFIVGGLALWASNFTTTMVKTELSAQKVYFPEKGSEGFDAATYPELQQYAGQLVDSPAKAEAYANGYIGRHLEKIAGGKVYSEVSTEAKKDPTNVKLQQQKASLFQGETLRGILLTSGYGFGTVGEIAGIAAIVAFITSGMLAILGTIFLFKRNA
jgi:hypothetical protein